MRLIKIVLGIAVLAFIVFAATGIVYVRNNKDNAGVMIDKKELKEKTHDVIDKTREAGSKGLERMGKALHKAGEEIKQPPDRQVRSEPAETPKPESNSNPDGNGTPEKADRATDRITR